MRDGQFIDATSDVVLPALRAVFAADEVSDISVTTGPEAGTVSVTIMVEGETFHDHVVQGGVPGVGVEEWRERLRSNLADFVAESRFGWGQNRGV